MINVDFSHQNKRNYKKFKLDFLGFKVSQLT